MLLENLINEFPAEYDREAIARLAWSLASEMRNNEDASSAIPLAQFAGIVPIPYPVTQTSGLPWEHPEVGRHAKEVSNKLSKYREAIYTELRSYQLVEDSHTRPDEEISELEFEVLANDHAAALAARESLANQVEVGAIEIQEVLNKWVEMETARYAERLHQITKWYKASHVDFPKMIYQLSLGTPKEYPYAPQY